MREADAPMADRRPMEIAFAGPGGAPEPHLSVDGMTPRGPNLSHWPGNRTPPHWKADLKPTPHAVTEGVTGTTIEDEWYFNMHFREGMEGVTTLISATPNDANITVHRRGGRWWSDVVEAALNRPQALMWATEREDGGRGIGFTGGHWHRNWANDIQRKLVLNGMLWTAGAAVPKGGVESKVSAEEMSKNLDDKPARKPRPKRKPKPKAK